MTDAANNLDARTALRRFDVTSDAAAERVKRRYRSERRFRAFGLAAVLFAALFLVILLTDILIKAAPAWTQSNLRFDVPVKTEHVDAANPKAGDFDAAVRDGLRALFPTVTSRGDRKALSAILSSGAADHVRSKVLGDPGLIGSVVNEPIPLSSDAELYLKGVTTGTRRLAGEGAAKPSGTTGAISISAGAGSLAPELALIKKISIERAGALDREAARLELAIQSVSADLVAGQAAAASGEAAQEAVKKLAESKASLEASLEAARARAEALRKRSADTSGSETFDTAMPSLLVMINGGAVKVNRIGPGSLDGDVIVPLASDGEAAAGAWSLLVIEKPEDSRKIQDREVAFLELLKDKNAVSSSFNWRFFSSGDSREPELAGILGALAGSALTMLLTLAICLPAGVGAAVYLEEFAPKNRWTDLLEVNINNLAAVPSIVFGLLGLAIFLNFFGLPRSSPLVGGLVLALLVLPTIIIASRAALKAVPPSIREAALGVGASRQQAIFHHVLPLAMPGVMTGTIIGMAHALGETAPLLMIGMIAFIVDVPGSISDPATVLPVQIFLWSDLPEVGFQAKTAAAIVVLLLFLFVMNGLAIWLRRKFERRW